MTTTISSAPLYASALPTVEMPATARGMDMETAMGLITTKYDNLTKIFNDAMDTEKNRQKVLTKVHDAKQELQPFAGRDVDPDGVNTVQEHQAVRDAAGRAADDLVAAGYPESDPTVTKLRSIQAKSDKISSTDIADALSGIDDKTASLTSDSQISMLSLQDTMSKVQTLMSMATNLESSFHDMQKGIVANMHV